MKKLRSNNQKFDFLAKIKPQELQRWLKLVQK